MSPFYRFLLILQYLQSSFDTTQPVAVCNYFTEFVNALESMPLKNDQINNHKYQFTCTVVVFAFSSAQNLVSCGYPTNEIPQRVTLMVIEIIGKFKKILLKGKYIKKCVGAANLFVAVDILLLTIVSSCCRQIFFEG